MNSPEKNNYIQYVNQSGFVKTRNVVFVDNGETTTFDVGGVNEDFFIFAVFQNNVQRFGIGFENFDNNDMLGFINTSVVDLGLVPSNAFLASEQVVTMSYNNAYVKSLTKPDPVVFPAVQVVNVNNFPVDVVQRVSLTNLNDEIATVSVLGFNQDELYAYDVQGNFISDQYGNVGTNVNVMRSEDELFLEQYCKIAFPNNPFTIRAFVHILSDGYNLDLNHGTKLYYSYLEASLIEARIFSVGQNQMSPNPFDKRFNPKAKKQLYNRLRFSLGGALPDTPLDYVEMVSGYVAIFNNDITGG